MNFRLGKKAVIGKFMVTFVAVILIILILIGYAVLGVFFKMFEGHTAALDEKYEEAKVSYDCYFGSFIKLVRVRSLIRSGDSVEDALRKSDYYGVCVKSLKEYARDIESTEPGLISKLYAGGMT